MSECPECGSDGDHVTAKELELDSPVVRETGMKWYCKKRRSSLLSRLEDGTHIHHNFSILGWSDKICEGELVAFVPDDREAESTTELEADRG